MVGENMLTWKSWPTDSESECLAKLRYFLVTMTLLQPEAATKEIATSLRSNHSRVLPQFSVRKYDGVVFRSAEIELAGQIRPNADPYSSHKHLYFAQLQGYVSGHRPAVHQYGVCQGTERGKKKTTHKKADGGMDQMRLSLRGKGKRSEVEFMSISLARFC